MTARRTAQVGTVIHGTLRTEDLLEAFGKELLFLTDTDRSVAEAKLLCDAFEADPDSEFAGEVVHELVDTLNGYAPEGFYFGAHEGDGSDFGFWPHEPE
jgi:hypothetical protein